MRFVGATVVVSLIYTNSIWKYLMSEVFPIPNEGSILFCPISTILNARGPLLAPCIVQVRGCRTIRHYYHIRRRFGPNAILPWLTLPAK